MTHAFVKRPFSTKEVAKVLRLYREERLSYKQIGVVMGRNHSSIGYLVRREDMREEQRLLDQENAILDPRNQP